MQTSTSRCERVAGNTKISMNETKINHPNASPLKRALKAVREMSAKLEAMETGKTTKTDETILPEIDSEILSFISEHGKVTAEDVRKKFKYKGKNAASARLNRLCSMGLLKKKQAGKKVFFFP